MQHKQVLCVDDEPDVIYRIKRFIERRYPIDVTVAVTPEQALEIMEKQEFDAVLTDVSMGTVMTGLDLTAEIIRLYPKTIVVVITGSGDYGMIARAKGLRFMAKPVSIRDFEHMIYENFGMLSL